MAHLPPENLPAFPPFSQSKTLFTAAPGRDAVLVEVRAGRPRQKNLHFKDAFAALTWSIKNGATFVHVPATAHLAQN